MWLIRFMSSPSSISTSQLQNSRFLTVGYGLNEFSHSPDNKPLGCTGKSLIQWSAGFSQSGNHSTLTMRLSYSMLPINIESCLASLVTWGGCQIVSWFPETFRMSRLKKRGDCPRVFQEFWTALTGLTGEVSDTVDQHPQASPESHEQTNCSLQWIPWKNANLHSEL